jgi:hypothetical protein
MNQENSAASLTSGPPIKSKKNRLLFCKTWSKVTAERGYPF